VPTIHNNASDSWLKGEVVRLTEEEARNLLDQQARKFLNMSGLEFVQAYRSGAIRNPHSLAVARVAMLLPLADD
jgi:hypothetical protein